MTDCTFVTKDTLEALVEQQAKEIAEEPSGEESTEIAEALKEMQSDDLEGLAELEPIVEQGVDPWVEQNITYDITLAQYESSSYGEQKTYYELVNEDGKYGATARVIAEHYEHEQLQEAQQIQQEVRKASESYSVHMQSFIDAKTKETKESFKAFAWDMWVLMYDGKIIFN